MTEWLNGIVGEAIAPYASIAIALLVVFLLIALLFRILRAFSSGKFGSMHQNRLGITEAIALEGKRRLVMVRRDDVEHLVLIGGENDLVIEQGIKKASPATTDATKPAPAKPAAQSQTKPQPAKPQATQQNTQPAPQPANQPATQPQKAQPAKPQATQQNTQPAPQPANQPATQPQKAQPEAPAQRQAVSSTPSPSPTPSTAPVTAPVTAKASSAVTPETNTVKPVQNTQTTSDSAKVKEMNRILDQLAGD